MRNRFRRAESLSRTYGDQRRRPTGDRRAARAQGVLRRAGATSEGSARDRVVSVTEDGTAADVSSTSEVTSWVSRIERGVDRLLQGSHVASPDEVPHLVADAAGIFGGEDVVTYVADLRQRVLVPFRHAEGSRSEAYPQVLGVDST